MTWMLCLFCGSWSRIETQIIDRGGYGRCQRAECRCEAMTFEALREKAEIASWAVMQGVTYA